MSLYAFLIKTSIESTTVSVRKFNPIALDTGSHVFQIHLTNANGMIGKAFIGETTGDWMNGDIHLGFNMSRTFKLKGRRY